MIFRSSLAIAFSLGLVLSAPIADAQTGAVPPQAGILVDQMQVSGSTWSFSKDLPDLSGPWSSVTITNTNCTRPYLPGSAQAGAVIFTAPLSPGPSADATLQPFVGSAATGHVRVQSMADTRGTNITATLEGLEPFVQNNTLSVCLTLGPPPPMLADITVDEQRVAAKNFDATGVGTAVADANPALIAISGKQTTPEGANRQQVFFFVGDRFLGTDTSTPSMAPLQLVGSPGVNQIAVSYDDPAGGAAITITYTLADGMLTPNGTPPGH